MWEKKTTAVGSGPSTLDVRDVDNKFTWEYAMNDYVDRLNGRLIANATDGAFARHNDWRIPTMQELQTIVEPVGAGAHQCGLWTERAGQLLDIVEAAARSDVRFRGTSASVTTSPSTSASPSASTSGRCATRAESGPRYRAARSFCASRYA